MRLTVIFLIGATVFVFPCAWDSAPQTIQPVAAILAKISARAMLPRFPTPHEVLHTDLQIAKAH